MDNARRVLRGFLRHDAAWQSAADFLIGQFGEIIPLCNQPFFKASLDYHFPMQFPTTDAYWQTVAAFLRKKFGEKVKLLGPNEFHELFPRTFPYFVQHEIDLNELEVFVVHKGLMEYLDDATLQWIVKTKQPAFGNEVFAIFTQPTGNKATEGLIHFKPVFDECQKRTTTPTIEKYPLVDEGLTAIVVTTYNRPQFLERTLATLAPFNLPMLVVNDGSTEKFRQDYATVYSRYPVTVVELPINRGLPTALNVALSYWLASDTVEWISYFQDDVEAHPDLFRVLARVQHPIERPLLSGRLDPLYKVYEEKEVNGVRLALQRTCSGMHLHGHHTYWKKVMPLPTPYLGAPKNRPHGSNIDWWTTCWSPESVTKQDNYVHIVPRYVRTFAELGQSTWGNEALSLSDPELAR